VLKNAIYSVLGLVFLLSGCATTGRNYEADINALNSKVAALQGQLSAKDEEISRLEGQMREEEAARRDAESERQRLAAKLDNALTSRESKSKASQGRPDSDLK